MIPLNIMKIHSSNCKVKAEERKKVLKLNIKMAKLCDTAY